MSLVAVAAMRPLPQAGLITTGLPLEGIEENSVPNNISIGLWSIAI